MKVEQVKNKIDVKDTLYLFSEMQGWPNPEVTNAAPALAVTPPIVPPPQSPPERMPMDSWMSTYRQCCVAMEGMKYAMQEMKDYSECGEAYMNGEQTFGEGMSLPQYTESVLQEMGRAMSAMEQYIESCGKSHG